MYNKPLSAQHTNFVNITFLTVSESKYKKSLAGKPLLVTKQPLWVCVKFGVDSSSIVSLESRIWQMDIYVVQGASIGPPRESFFRRNKTHLGPLRLEKLFWNKWKLRLINVHHSSTRSTRLLIIWNITLKHNGTQEMWPYYQFSNMNFKFS